MVTPLSGSTELHSVFSLSNCQQPFTGVGADEAGRRPTSPALKSWTGTNSFSRYPSKYLLSSASLIILTSTPHGDTRKRSRKRTREHTRERGDTE